MAKDFKQWMKEVDAAVQEKMRLSVFDLPDCPFMDWFNDGVTPTRAAAKAIRSAKDEW